MSPYAESGTFEYGGWANQLNGNILAPGETLSFAFFTIDTLQTIPAGMVVEIASGHLLFENFPPTIPNPSGDPNYFDIEVSASVADAQAIALGPSPVPEPASASLFTAALVALATSRLRRPAGRSLR